MSCGWNLFCHVLGDPSPNGLNTSLKKATADLQSAKASGDKVAVQAALNRMKTINAKQRVVSNNAIAQVNAIDSTLTATKNVISSVASAGNRILIVAGLVAVWAIFKK